MRIALTYNEKRVDHEDHAEFDTREAIAGVARIVASLGHAVTLVEVSGSIPRLIARLSRLAPDLVLNLAEGERGTFREAFYPALFEQLGLAHTGSPASVLALCLDKVLAKRVVAAAGVRVPRGCHVRGDVDRAALAELGVPLIVKPNCEGSSKGITAASVITDHAELASAVAVALERYPAGVLVEELIEGSDVAVGWARGLGLLPAIRYRYAAAGPYAIYDYELKHVAPERVEIECPAALPDDVRGRLEHAATTAFDALGVVGYGRADFRVTPGGEIVFLEMNPLPSLTPAVGHDELYVAAARLGKTPRDLLALILGAGPATSQRPSRTVLESDPGGPSPPVD